MAIIETDPTEVPVATHEQTLSELDSDEVSSFSKAPTINPSDYSKKADWFALAGQGFMDSLVQQGIDTTATTFILVGRKIKESQLEQDPSLQIEDNALIKTGEKIRSFGIAVRKKLALDDANKAAPTDMGGKVASGLGSAGGSMLGLILASGIGAAAGGAVAGPPGAVVGGVAVGYTEDYLNEKAMMAKELMDAGYSANFSDKVSNYYAIPVAALDFVSFKALGKLLRPAASRAVKGALIRRIAGAAVAGAEGILMEGGTEGVQQRIQTETEIATKLRKRDFQEDLTDDAVAFVVGGMIGGAAGVAGQVQLRRDTINKFVEATGLEHDAVAKAVDDAFLHANDAIYDTLIEHFDVSKDMAWIDRAFEKIDGKSELSPMPENLDDTTSDEYQTYGKLLDAVQVEKDAKALPKQLGKLTSDIRNAERQQQDLSGEDLLKAQTSLAELTAELNATKEKYSELLAKSPKLTALIEEGDALIEEYKTADESGKMKIEQRIDDINFALQNPGSVNEVAKAAETKVAALQTEAMTKLTELEKAEADPARVDELPGLRKEFMESSSALMRADRQLAGVQTVANKLNGKVALTSGQVKVAMRQQLRQLLDAYKTGKEFSRKDVKNIQMAFRTLLQGSNLSRKSVLSMLRSVLSIRTPEQFNAKIGVVMGHINTIIRSEKVAGYQKIGWKILEKMKTSEGKVTTDAQTFSEHLRRLFRGVVPLSFDIESNKVEDVVKAQVEQAVYDLKNSEDDVSAARRSLETLKGYYQNKLQKFQDFKKSQVETYQRIADNLEKSLLKGEKFDDLKKAFDHTRQKDKRKNRFLMTPYDTSIMSILNMLDNASGAKNMEGPLVKEFMTDVPYQAMIVLKHQAKEWIEGKLYEIYGKKALDLWIRTRTEDFVDVKFSGEKGERTVNISRAQAMSLYLMTKMPGVRNELLKNGINEEWLNSFTLGENVQFSKEDYSYMEALRESLDWIADEIAPVFERLTGRPFRRVDNYFMTSRFMAKSLEKGGIADTNSIIDEMLSGDFSKLDPTDVDSLKKRSKSDQSFAIPDVFEAISFYMEDMTHFAAYADYAVRIQKVFQNQRIRKIMADKMPPAYLAVMDEYIKTLAGGSINRSSDRKAMSGLFRILGRYARNQVATPKNFLRQLSGIGAAMDLDGAGPVKFLEAVADLPRAIKSGELRRLTETSYMKERLAGLYEMAVLYVQEQSRSGKIEGSTSKRLHDFFTSFPRYGDRMASVMVGWMIYRDRMAKTNDSVFAVQEAIRAIDVTQQSMDAGKTPVAFNRPDLPSRLLTLFQRTPAIYLDRYLNTWKAFRAGRMSKKDFARAMITYHVWVPLLEVLVTSGDLEPDETLLAMLAGPLSYHLIIGATIRSIIAGAMEGLSDGEADLPFYLKGATDSTLVGSMARDLLKAGKAAAELMAYPDYETMWGAWKALGGIGDAGPLPTGWLTRIPEGFYELLQGDPESIIRGIKTLAGWPESRTQEAS